MGMPYVPIMSTPACVRPPDRGAPKESTNEVPGAGQAWSAPPVTVGMLPDPLPPPPPVGAEAAWRAAVELLGEDGDPGDDVPVVLGHLVQEDHPVGELREGLRGEEEVDSA